MIGFIWSGSEPRIYKISSGNKFNGMSGDYFSENHFIIFWWWRIKFFIRFSKVLQRASTDIYMATQNWIQNTTSPQN